MKKLNLALTVAALGFSASTLAADHERPGRAAFDELDTDGSGSVSFAEFQQRGSAALTSIDNDQNGVLTIDEFLNARPDRGPRMGKRANRENGDKENSENREDGVAASAEAGEDRRAPRQEMMVQRATERFTAMDRDGDEIVTIEEFQEANFLRMDRDNDGVLTARELRNSRGGPGGRRGSGNGGRPGEQRGGQSPQA